MDSVEMQVADIRERVAGIEAQLRCMQGTLDTYKKDHSGGSVVIPVAVVITVLEIVKVVIERLS